MRRCLLTMALGLLFACAQPARAGFISQVLGDNPKGFWILNDVPGATTTAVDSSVNGFNGAYGPGVTPQGIAGPSWVPPSGLVANFTGGTISFATPLSLGANGYTIEAWINPTLSSLMNTTRIVASGSGLNGYGFGTAAGAGLVFTSFAQHDYFTTGVTLLPNRWQYVGVVVDASNDANFYVNGSFVESMAGILPTIPPTLNFTIGNQSPGLGHTDEIFTGGLAGISVYDTALTARRFRLSSMRRRRQSPNPLPSCWLAWPPLVSDSVCGNAAGRQTARFRGRKDLPTHSCAPYKMFHGGIEYVASPGVTRRHKERAGNNLPAFPKYFVGGTIARDRVAVTRILEGAAWTRTHRNGEWTDKFATIPGIRDFSQKPLGQDTRKAIKENDGPMDETSCPLKGTKVHHRRPRA